jgi:DNA-binding GntR family transcriptional regulator
VRVDIKLVTGHTSVQKRKMKFKKLKRPSKTEEIRKILYKSLKQNEFAPGDLIPSENELSKKFNVGRYTVRESITSLVTEGFLQRIQGKGTMVAAPPDTKEAGIVFFNIYDPAESYVHDIISGIEEKARINDWRLHIYTTRGKNIRSI